jgi:hypothetical protein
LFPICVAVDPRRPDGSAQHRAQQSRIPVFILDIVVSVLHPTV